MSKRRLPITKETGTPRYWRGLDHLAGKPQVQAMLEREFPEGASEIDGTTRRTFMTLMSASFAMMGVTGCVRRPVEKIVPYAHAPEGVIPGVAQFYATTLPLFGEGVGVVVESHEGRPTKIEGNTEHPASLGGTHAILQAMVLDLYDPDRQQKPTKDGHDVDFLAVDQELDARLKAAEGGGGAKVRVLTGALASPTADRLKAAVTKRFPQARVYEYDAGVYGGPAAGARLAFGKPVAAHVDYDRAAVVVAVDSDFLMNEPGAVLNNRLFTRRRRVRDPNARMNRLYVAEPALTVTGMNADHRVRLHAGAAEDFLLALASELGQQGVTIAAVAGKARGVPEGTAALVKAAARELQHNRGTSVVVVGARQTPAAHALGWAINDALGNVGKTVRLSAANAPVDYGAEIKSLVDEMNRGAVETLLVLGGNPVYDAPGDLNFAEALKKVTTRFRLGSHFDETSLHCNLTMPRAHDLESWGDRRSSDGTIGLVQPLIAPMYNGRSDVELLAALTNEPSRRGHDLVRATFTAIAAASAGGNDHGPVTMGAPAGSAKTGAPAASAAPPAGSSGGAPHARPAMSAPHVGAAPVPNAPHAPAGAKSASPAASGSAAPLATGSTSAGPIVPAPTAPTGAMTAGEKAWRRALHNGFVEGSSAARVDATVDNDAVAGALGKQPFTPPTPQSLEVTFAPDVALGDGRYANVPWLQELPHPVTKTVWDNTAWLSAKTANALGVESGDVVRLNVGGHSIDTPVWVVPGTVDNSVQLHLGWGRTKAGRVGDGRGVDVNPLRRAASLFVASGGKIEKTEAVFEVVVTQEHNMIEGRPIVREGTLDGYRKDPKFAEKQGTEHPELTALWQERKYEGHKWGMVIDLTACTGCNACVIACQAENNVPTVGKEQVSRQREMHWLRIDRYFSSRDPSRPELALDDPQTITQPMLCQHCENAPCENVCPVNATSHSPEGLNEMTYNRCIGTRYCSNNCPYKVRRFNFLDYHGEVPETVKMVANPNVSVRMRGVMEKCSFCVQRINNAKISAKRDKRLLKDGDVVSACAQACPADAIVFGDLNDPGSRVAHMAEVEHGYRVLDELNTKPRTTYLAKIRNPNPELA